MKRLITIARLFLSLLSSGATILPKLWWLGRSNPHLAEDYLLARARVWACGAVAMTGASVRVVGAEKIPAEGAVLYVANHQGVLDIPILMGHLPGSPAFVAKKELFGIPLLGYWMRRIGCIGLDRENPRAARKAIMAGAKRVRVGRRLVLFPEGTRSRDPGGRMAPFKRGSLKLASAADAVVVPVTVEGSRFLLGAPAPDGFTGEVQVIIGDPVDVGALDPVQQKALPEQIHNIIESTLEAHHMGETTQTVIQP